MCVLGIRQSERVPISELCKLTSPNSRYDRRRCTLVRFMTKVVNNRIFSTLRSNCNRYIPTYATRPHEVFVVAKFNTSIGSRRVVVRGLKLLNLANRN
jgi:hypothetical protein